MGYQIYYDSDRNRDLGYGVPAYCDHPGCNKKIDRGLAYVCGGAPYSNEHGCALYFCYEHLFHAQEDGVQRCERCSEYREWFEPKADHPEWVQWKLTDLSWQDWRDKNPEWVKNHIGILIEVR